MLTHALWGRILPFVFSTGLCRTVHSCLMCVLYPPERLVHAQAIFNIAATMLYMHVEI